MALLSSRAPLNLSKLKQLNNLPDALRPANYLAPALLHRVASGLTVKAKPREQSLELQLICP